MEKNKKNSYRNLIILIVAIVLLIIIGITITMARYRSTGTGEVVAEVAFFTVEEGFQHGNIMLEGLYPRAEAFEYDFTVSNTKETDNGTKVAETSMEYNMELVITTNLPLQIEIYKEGTKLTSEDDIENSIELDSTGQCYIRRIKIKNGSFTFNQGKTDTYTLSAVFPESYSSVEEYEGMIDNVAITLEAKQKIN